jgi:leader peptidase (prepilin peptidase) / N-methyltransferase
MYAVVAGLLGLLFGSFFNVCIHRLPQHHSVVRPRSYCPSCGRQLAWYDNVPVLSFMLLRRRCRYCRASISWRYPLVELSTALFFYVVVHRWGISVESLKWVVCASLLEILFWTDLETRLLPDVLTLGGLTIALLLSVWGPAQSGVGTVLLPQMPVYIQSFAGAVLSALVLSVPLWAVAEGYARLRGIEPPGFGDIKLLALLGAFLGMEAGVLALLIGSVTGSILGLGYIVGTGKDPRRHALPFGSFLCVGGLVVVFWGDKLLQLWMGRGA